MTKAASTARRSASQMQTMTMVTVLIAAFPSAARAYSRRGPPSGGPLEAPQARARLSPKRLRRRLDQLLDLLLLELEIGVRFLRVHLDVLEELLLALRRERTGAIHTRVPALDGIRHLSHLHG